LERNWLRLATQTTIAAEHALVQGTRTNQRMELIAGAEILVKEEAEVVARVAVEVERAVEKEVPVTAVQQKKVAKVLSREAEEVKALQLAGAVVCRHAIKMLRRLEMQPDMQVSRLILGQQGQVAKVSSQN